jgi:hypothetical protein
MSEFELVRGVRVKWYGIMGYVLGTQPDGVDLVMRGLGYMYLPWDSALSELEAA